jgi:hypothetical protein
MDLTQRKLTRAEWNSIELPISEEELRITTLIKEGYHDVNIKKNYTASLLKYMKVPYSDGIDNYVYVHYLQNSLLALGKKYQLVIKQVEFNSKMMKKADIIRFSNTDKHIDEQKTNIFEFVILGFLEKIYKLRLEASSPKLKKKSEINHTWVYYYFTIKKIINYNVGLINNCFKTTVLALLSVLDGEIEVENLVASGYELIERNEHLLKYADETLYEHQKRLFSTCKRPNPKLILYIAPTGTGKTLSPLGLSEAHKVIFVCAARHVGLALAKAAISSDKCVAFAFGCSDSGDIRLHYSSAKEFTRNKKSGSIDKVDNSIGDKVEIMISDIKSYIPAMLYMLAFNPKEKIILYWDEPTITLDYPTHEFHEIIKNNWSKNLIPNVVLSSATLPRINELAETIADFRSTFDNADVHEIISHDCKKTIPIINKEGYVEMPHYLFDNYPDILNTVKHCNEFKTILRYIDLAEAIKFIMYVNKEHSATNDFINNERYKLTNHFPSIDAINMENIKIYYLELLGNLNEEKWKSIYKFMLDDRKQKMLSNINIVTTDAHTLTDGPTIFLADDVEKIGRFYIQNANIPEIVMKDIMTVIEANTKLNEKIAVLEKDLEDGTKKDEGKEKKMNEGRVDPEMKKLMYKIEAMKLQVKTVALNTAFVPNTKEHIYKYAPRVENFAGTPYTSAISEYIVEQIMLLDDVEDNWKLLLLMGIGLIATHNSSRYTEIMKTLAQEQKLYLIIASTDYIYGTNYQFCHGYISKDLGCISQEKCVQAMGRVGRNKLQHDYSVRFRDNSLILKLFQKEMDKPEVYNMNLLFNSC